MLIHHDFCTPDGAFGLAARLKRYWEERGVQPPEFKVVHCQYAAVVRIARHDVRSDMINGLPRSIYYAKQERAA